MTAAQFTTHPTDFSPDMCYPAPKIIVLLLQFCHKVLRCHARIFVSKTIVRLVRSVRGKYAHFCGRVSRHTKSYGYCWRRRHGMRFKLCTPVNASVAKHTHTQIVTLHPGTYLSLSLPLSLCVCVCHAANQIRTGCDIRAARSLNASRQR